MLTIKKARTFPVDEPGALFCVGVFLDVSEVGEFAVV